MNRRSLLQLTPLVDVLLILLFAVIINVHHESDDVVKEQEKLKDEFKEINVSLAIEKEKNKEISEIITEIFKLENKLNNNSSNNELTNSKYILKELIKYDAISDNMAVIDLSLGGDNNRLYIDGEATNIYITYEEITDSEKRKGKIDEIKSKIESSINKNKNSKIILITLGLRDNEVYKFAYDLLEKTIKSSIRENDELTIIYTELILGG